MKVIEKYIPDSDKIYKAKEPFEATVIENIKLTLANSEDDIRHLVIDLSQSGIFGRTVDWSCKTDGGRRA